MPQGIGVGVLAAMVAVGQLTRWISVLATTLAKHGGDFLGEPRRRLLWAAPIFSILHPGFYVALATVIAPWYLLQRETTDFFRSVAIGYYAPLILSVWGITRALIGMKRKGVERLRI